MSQATKEQIEELRLQFNNKFESVHGSNEDIFHPKDLNKIYNTDTWLARFIDHNDGNVIEAANMLWDTLEWRKKMGVNEIGEENVRMDYLIDGAFFTRNRDKDGCRLFIFKSKKYVKGQKDFEELKRCVLYWFERLEKIENGTKQITLFFDMADCGLSNMDTEFTKYLIGLFKQYYPNFLNYILIFEMPWVLNAAFKIIKSWLPAKAVEKIKFVSKKTLSEYVAPDQALKCWGGQDDYIFTFVPLDLIEIDNDESEIGAGEGVTNGNNRKVHFAEGSNSVNEKSDSNSNNSLQIHPSEIIVFYKDGKELHGNFTITNRCLQNLSYKVKTTSPEKFRVRPSSGCLEPNGTTTVNVTLQPGFQLGGLTRDKFLIMSTLVDSTVMTVAEINELWKNVHSKQVEQHRLRCSEPPNAIITRNGISLSNSSTLDPSTIQLNSILTSVQKLNDCQIHLQKSIRRTEILQLLNLILFLTLSIALFYVVRNETNLFGSNTCYRE